MFYETWYTISKVLIISLSLPIPHCDGFLVTGILYFISDYTQEFCLFGEDIFGTLFGKFYYRPKFRKELVILISPPPLPF